MKPPFAIIFVIALSILIYLVFIHKPAERTSFHGPTGLPYVQGPGKPPPAQ